MTWWRNAVLAVLTVMSFAIETSAQQPAAREARIDAGNAALYARELGNGRAAIVLHGGPDFDHRYLLPEFDAFHDMFRLIYYDQRGRGFSAEGVRPEDVTLSSELADLERVRQHFALDAPVLIGHSWGTVLALEYALRYPERVSRLILMNPAPASARDVALMRNYYLARIGSAMQQQREIASGAAYQSGDPAAVTARYRIHFRPALERAKDFEKLMTRMSSAFAQQGSAGIIKARAVEDRLMADTWADSTYDLLPGLRTLRVPTLVVWADADFIPLEVSRHIADAIPDAKLVTIQNCGHFSYLECPNELRAALREFLP